MLQNRDGEVKLFNLFGLFSTFLFVLLGFSALEAKDSFKEFKKSQTESFKTYKDENDNAFRSYLKQQWESYSASVSSPLYEKPKPIDIAPAPAHEAPSVGPKVNIIVDKQGNGAINELKDESFVKTSKADDVVVEFYGSKFVYAISQNIKKANFYPNNQAGVANFFDAIASSEYEDVVLDIQEKAKDMRLNDWGVYMLVTKIANATFSDENNAKLFSWFIFNKLGYAVKVGVAKNRVVLMHYATKSIYSTPTYTIANKKYYALWESAKESPKGVVSYKQEYPNAIKELDLSLEILPKFQEKREKKELKFSNLGTTYAFSFSYNKNLIDFMASYPQADYEVFFNAPMEDITYQELANSFKEYLNGKKSSEAINFVLHFVQNSFDYQQDNEHFSREKVMFAEETLFYERSDCEDRAVLFSYLVKRLFGISVVGVKYDDHMATALYIPLDGDKVEIKSKEFIIADPTYKNASVGMSMPKYKSIKPKSYIMVKNS